MFHLREYNVSASRYPVNTGKLAYAVTAVIILLNNAKIYFFIASFPTEMTKKLKTTEMVVLEKDVIIILDKHKKQTKKRRGPQISFRTLKT